MVQATSKPGRRVITVAEWLLNLWIFGTTLGVIVVALIFIPFAVEQLKELFK